jgi:cell division protein FtsI (penicillin-binding protein 3)
VPFVETIRTRFLAGCSGTGDAGEDPPPIRRLRILIRLFLLWALLILATLVQLQIVKHGEFARMARAQQQREVEINAPRGMILDRNLKPLAMSLPVDSVCVNPQKIADVTVAADILSSVLNLDRDQLLARLLAAKVMQKGFLWVERKVTEEESRRLRSYKLPYVEFRKESHRFYPKGRLAAQVVGTVGMLEEEERGVVGLESYFEDDLQGRPGSLKLVTDSRQRGVDATVTVEPVAGQDIVCTIDERIQFVAERELAKAVVEHKCKTGSLVAMDPNTGEILAMASYPTYDPNEPVKKGEDLSPRLNLAISAPFEPGSVFKVITVAAALERTNLRPATIIPCGNGVINLFGRIIHDHDPYSALSMTDVLAKSSNIGAIQVGLRVGESTLHEYVQRFGFGRPTGIELPAESPGLVRKLKAWSKSSIGSVAMGHEVSVTTLQLAQACAVAANGGFLVRPTVLLRRGRDQQSLRKVSQEKPVRVMSPENAMTLRRMMEEVVLSGTGKKARLDGYRAAGKTGSAQIFDFDSHTYTHRYNASFMGFAPVTNPRIVVVVTLNGASLYGGAVAAPVFRQVAGAALRILDVPRDAVLEDAGEPGNDNLNDLPPAQLAAEPEETMLRPISVAAAPPREIVRPGALAAPDFRGKSLKAVLEIASAAGIQVVFSGAGVARRQHPAPGQVLSPGETVRVELER